MPQALSITRFQSDMNQFFDNMLKTGIPLEIEYKGKKFIISPAEPSDKMANLIPHPDCITGDPEDIVHMDWSKEWKHDLP